MKKTWPFGSAGSCTRTEEQIRWSTIYHFTGMGLTLAVQNTFADIVACSYGMDQHTRNGLIRYLWIPFFPSRNLKLPLCCRQQFPDILVKLGCLPLSINILYRLIFISIGNWKRHPPHGVVTTDLCFSSCVRISGLSLRAGNLKWKAMIRNPSGSWEMGTKCSPFPLTFALELSVCLILYVPTGHLSFASSSRSCIRFLFPLFLSCEVQIHTGWTTIIVSLPTERHLWRTRDVAY